MIPFPPDRRLRPSRDRPQTSRDRMSPCPAWLWAARSCRSPSRPGLPTHEVLARCIQCHRSTGLRCRSRELLLRDERVRGRRPLRRRCPAIGPCQRRPTGRSTSTLRKRKQSSALSADPFVVAAPTAVRSGSSRPQSNWGSNRPCVFAATLAETRHEAPGFARPRKARAPCVGRSRC